MAITAAATVIAEALRIDPSFAPFMKRAEDPRPTAKSKRKWLLEGHGDPPERAGEGFVTFW
jgi:hypothetical protein